MKKMYTIGIDVGGTKMSAVLFDGQRVLADDVLATPQDDFNHFMVMVEALLDSMLDKAKELKVKVFGIGMGVAGVHSSDKLRVLFSPNLLIINNKPIAGLVREKYDIPCVMENDVSSFLRAEMLLGAGKKYSNVFGLTIGTGIGGAWWFDGRTYESPHGVCCEPGDLVINMETEQTLEKAYQKMTQNNPAKLADEAFRGDVLAQRTFEELGKIFGIALANIVNILDPEVFVVGGGVAESAELYFPQMKKSLKKHVTSSEAARKIKVVKSKLGANAVAIGAAILAAQHG